jgi:hypothetical protein
VASAVRVVAMGVGGGSELLGKSGDRPRGRRHHEQAGGDRGGRPQPAEPAERPAALRVRPEPGRDDPGGVPHPDDGGLEPARQRPQDHDRGRRPPGQPPPLPRGDLGPDSLEPASGGLERVGGHAQRVAKDVLQRGLARVFRSPVAHDSRSSTERSADIARDVWLLTAPRVIPIAVAICASDKSP